MTSVKQQDLELGKLSEAEVLPILNDVFGQKIEKIKNPFFVMDFESEKYYFELKTRNSK